MIVNQQTFIDGQDFVASDIQISKNGYYYLVNARQRLGYVEPNQKPIHITSVPPGKKQGIIAIGNILIAFIAGKAWWNLDETNVWIKIGGFSMSATADRFYSIAVPASTANYTRKLTSPLNINNISKTVDINVAGTPSAILVQDNINQPWIIQYDGTAFSARVTQAYADWQLTPTDQEYVPIGNQMMILNSKLFIVSQDFKSVYHSISGRPLDFMVNVDTDGNKLPTEAAGGVDTVSFAFDSDDITCIQDINIPDSFLYGTAKLTRIVTLDYLNTVFGEPRYSQSAKLVTGIVNQDSVADILGDYALMDFEGVKSFNAVQQLKFEGRNSIFSLQLSRLLKGKKQTRCRCTTYNNFGIFNLDTNWGNLFAIYDTVLGKWVALDSTEVAFVRQFTKLETDSETKLYAITELDELYQLYASEETESAQLHLKSFISVLPDGEDSIFYQQKSAYLKLFFQDGSADTIVRVTELVDGQLSRRLPKTLKSNIAGIKPPIMCPVIPNSKPRVQPITFAFPDGLEGTKLSYIIQWSSNAKLLAFQLETDDEAKTVAKKQMEETLNASKYGSNR